MKYTVQLDDAEVKAMEYVAVNVQEWIENVVNHKIKTCKDEFMRRYISQQEARNESIRTDVDKLIEELNEPSAIVRLGSKPYKMNPDDPFNSFLIP